MACPTNDAASGQLCEFSDGNCLPIPKLDQDKAMDAAQCIGCGACVAACPNASAMLFVSAKVSHLANLPQDFFTYRPEPLHARRQRRGIQARNVRLRG